MPFDLRNAAQTFQRFINEVLRGLPVVYAYIDDLLIASATEEEHLQHLQLVLGQLQEHDIPISVAKSVLGVPDLDFLGHHVDTNGICPLAERVQAIQKYLIAYTLSHPGIQATQHMLTSRFLWPHTNSDVCTWTHSCLQ